MSGSNVVSLKDRKPELVINVEEEPGLVVIKAGDFVERTLFSNSVLELRAITLIIKRLITAEPLDRAVRVHVICPKDSVLARHLISVLRKNLPRSVTKTPTDLVAAGRLNRVTTDHVTVTTEVIGDHPTLSISCYFDKGVFAGEALLRLKDGVVNCAVVVFMAHDLGDGLAMFLASGSYQRAIRTETGDGPYTALYLDHLSVTEDGGKLQDYIEGLCARGPDGQPFFSWGGAVTDASGEIGLFDNPLRVLTENKRLVLKDLLNGAVLTSDIPFAATRVG